VYQIHWILMILIFPEIAIFRQWVLACCKKIPRFLKLSTFLFDL